MMRYVLLTVHIPLLFAFIYSSKMEREFLEKYKAEVDKRRGKRIKFVFVLNIRKKFLAIPSYVRRDTVYLFSVYPEVPQVCNGNKEISYKYSIQILRINKIYK